MIALIEGTQPKREEFPNPDGSVVVQVTQAMLFAPEGAKPARVYLTKSEYKAYREWLEKGGLLQYLLPTLSDSQREMLLTGICDEEFDDLKRALDEEMIDPEEDADGTHPSLPDQGSMYELVREQLSTPIREICERCGNAIRSDGGHMCGTCGRNI